MQVDLSKDNTDTGNKILFLFRKRSNKIDEMKENFNNNLFVMKFKETNSIISVLKPSNVCLFTIT